MMKKTIFIIILLYSAISAQPEFGIEQFLHGARVTDITSDGKNLWVSTDGNGIYRYSYDKDSWKNYSTKAKNLKLDFFYSISASKKYVWAGSTDGLFILNKKRNKWSKRKFGKGGQLGNWIRSLAYDKFHNVLWIGRFKFLSRFDAKKRRFSDYDLTIDGNEKTNTIKTIKVDGDSVIWFGTEAGIHKLRSSMKPDEKGAMIFIDNSNNNFESKAKSISFSAIVPEKKVIWFGLDEFVTKENPEYNTGGLYKYDRRANWERFDKHSGLPGNGIFDIAETGNYLWISTYEFNPNTKEQYGRGLALLNKKTETIKVINDERIPNNIYAIFFDGSFLWLGSDTGIFRIDLRNKFSPQFSKR